jgi:hypothetical protein
LLTITSRLFFFFCDCNMSNLVIGLLIDVPIDMARGVDDGLDVSFDVGVRLRLT